MNKPLISIIVPAYNSQASIERCLKSLVGQTYQNIQVVVVDDGSSDDTGKICDEYAKKYNNIKVLHQNNQGRLAARINGIKNSDGEYIGFHDSDDYSEPEMYEFLMKEMLDENADISHCTYEMIRGNEHTSYYGTGKREVHDRVAATRALLKGEYIEPTLCTKLFKKSLLENIVFTERIDTYEDLLINFQAFSKAKKIVYNDIVLYHYVRREKPDHNSDSFKKERADIKRVMRQLDGLSKNDSEIRKYVKKRIRRQCLHEYKIALMTRMS